MIVRPAACLLRTDMFPTLERDTTTSITISYTHTIADSRIDAAAMDAIDARKHFFGCSFHYVIMVDGTIEIGRNPKTLSARGRSSAYRHSTVYVGVVGGLHHDTGKRLDTMTEAQREALADLEQGIANVLQKHLHIMDHTTDWTSHGKLEEAQDAQEVAFEAELDRIEQASI